MTVLLSFLVHALAGAAAGSLVDAGAQAVANALGSGACPGAPGSILCAGWGPLAGAVVGLLARAGIHVAGVRPAAGTVGTTPPPAPGATTATPLPDAPLPPSETGVGIPLAQTLADVDLNPGP